MEKLFNSETEQKNIIWVISTILSCGGSDSRYLLDLLQTLYIFDDQCDLSEILDEMEINDKLNINSVICAAMHNIYNSVRSDFLDHMGGIDEPNEKESKIIKYMEDLEFSPYINALSSSYENIFDEIDFDSIKSLNMSYDEYMNYIFTQIKEQIMSEIMEDQDD